MLFVDLILVTIPVDNPLDLSLVNDHLIQGVAIEYIDKGFARLIHYVFWTANGMKWASEFFAVDQIQGIFHVLHHLPETDTGGIPPQLEASPPTTNRVGIAFSGQALHDFNEVIVGYRKVASDIGYGD